MGLARQSATNIAVATKQLRRVDLENQGKDDNQDNRAKAHPSTQQHANRESAARAAASAGTALVFDVNGIGVKIVKSHRFSFPLALDRS